MNRKLYVGNLPFSTEERTLEDLFNQAGPVTSVRVMRDKATGQSRGFAFVDMENASAAQKAIAELDGKDLEGRPLRVRIAEDRKPGGRGSSGGGGGRDDRGGRRGY